MIYGPGTQRSSRKSDRTTSIVPTWCPRGIRTRVAGRYDDALRHLTEMHDLAERIDNPELIASARVQLGNLAVLRGRPEQARALLDEALELSLASHSTRNVTLCLAGHPARVRRRRPGAGSARAESWLVAGLGVEVAHGA